MNYHIITQDKFFNQYIEDVYEIGQEDNNVFLIRGEKGEMPYLTTLRPVTYLGKDDKNLPQYLHQLKPQDKLYVAWYDWHIAQQIIASGIPNHLCVYVMGAEFYSEPFEWHAHWVYDKATYRKFQEIGEIPTIKWLRLNPKHYIRTWNEIKNYIQWHEHNRDTYRVRLQHIARIDSIVLAKGNSAEYNFLKSLYPTLRAKHVVGVFDQNYDMAKMMKAKSVMDDRYYVMLGNSSDPTNNHIDGMQFIKKHLRGQYKLYTILSYGDVLGRLWAEEEGYRIFSESFVPITGYMNRQKYMELLNQMDAFVMFHNRQQALGNIITALCLGKPVFMKKQNVLYRYLRELGLKSIYDIGCLDENPLKQYIEEARMFREDTIAAIERAFSKEARLSMLNALLCE